MPIDPRALSVMWQTSVNVGGKGMPMERLAMLAQIAGKQEMIMQTQGLTNPLVGVPEYRNTLSRMLETANIADVSSYFKALPPGFQAPPPPPTPPDPSLILAQVQAGKTAADVENDRASEQTKRAQMLTDDDLKRDQAALDAWTKTWVAGAQFGTPVPSLTEFQQAMASKVPGIQLLGNLPPPTQRAEARQAGPPPGQRRHRGATAARAASRGPRAVHGAATPTAAHGPACSAQLSPAQAMATRQALMQGNMPSAYGNIAAQRRRAEPLQAGRASPAAAGRATTTTRAITIRRNLWFHVHPDRQSTKTVPRQGQNKPQSGGAAGAGKARGGVQMPNITRTDLGPRPPPRVSADQHSTLCRRALTRSCGAAPRPIGCCKTVN